MEGTREGILSQISNWIDDFSMPNIILLMGDPRAGKPTIAATIVSDLDSCQRLGSSFAFKYGDASLSDPSAVWRTVASDLARFNGEVRDSLVKTSKGVDPGLHR
jgi:hypothetical protein